jgi:hypothetical protein
MAKNKTELLKEAKSRGMVADSVTEDDITADDLQTLLDPEPRAWKGSLSAKEPQVAPDGHVALSAEDIAARDAG